MALCLLLEFSTVALPSKRDALEQCCFDVGPASCWVRICGTRRVKVALWSISTHVAISQKDDTLNFNSFQFILMVLCTEQYQ